PAELRNERRDHHGGRDPHRRPRRRESVSPAASIWDRERVWVTLGAAALIFLGAIEALAVTTVMPVVSAALDGESLYAVAFAGTLATSVIGMVACGAWSDARGPRGALYVAVSLFIAG